MSPANLGMKSRLALTLLALIAVALGAFYLGRLSGHHHPAPAGADAAEKTLYTCGMHPQVIQDQPGNCPICGMKLTAIRRTPGSPTSSGGASASAERTVKYYKSSMIPGEVSPSPGKDSMGMDLVPVYEDEAAMDATIAIDPVTIQNMGLRTAVLTNGPLRRVIRTVATIDYEEPALADVTTKFRGWIETLHVDAVGAQVHRGDPLFEVYSPELYSAQTEYLLALQAGSQTGAEGLRETARTKLKYWDISPDQIAELEQTRQPRKTLRVLAPIDGFVVEKLAVDGQMVEAGMKLYRLADLALVWVHAQVYEQDLPFVRLGQEATVSLSYLPDRKFRGRVTYIYPTLDPKTRTVQVRMEFHNPGYFLKPGMFASVELVAELSPSTLLVPDMAVLRSGERNTVFVALDAGKFQARTVRLGARAQDDLLQVLGGLAAGERVVVSGQFMLDSESQLREAIQKMMDPTRSRSAHLEHAPEAQPTDPSNAAATPATTPGKTVYLCPMPEHVAIEYEAPGSCPLCGMTLVPVAADVLAKIHPGGAVQYYTCPMPEHADVRLDKPGKCPQCRMTLIPVMPQPPQPAPEPAAPLPPLYTCPMASHAHIVADQPGPCPECEMALVPTSSVKHGPKAEEHWRKAHPPSPPPNAVTRPLYTCPMSSHAHIVADQPGPCPECEMVLVPTSSVKHGPRAEDHWRQQRAP